ncbi:MAG: CpaF family protein [Lachnospiraceae bacterium]|nr:CpaF family protein [Lachnospiraceae bacterium]
MTEDELRTGIQRRISPLKEVTDADVMEQIDRMLLEDPDALRMSVRERLMLRKRLFDSLRRLDILQQLIEDESVTEIMVNGPGTIFVERSGRLERWDKTFTGKERLSDVIQQIVSRVNRAVNTASPIVDARLEDGSRVNAVLPPVAPDGPILTIRRFPKDPLVMQGLIRRNSISAEAAGFLKILVRCGYNLFISGGTGSGKTTFLNALSAFIPEHERIITIEDSLELQIQNIPNLVRLETRNRNAEGMGEITIRDLIRTALRMRPDRIIVQTKKFLRLTAI